MFQDWREAITVGLAVCTGLIAVAEFYGGPKLQGWINSKLEDWWIRLDYIRVPNVGRAEAAFALTTMQKLFGKCALTWHRLAASAVVVVVSFTTLLPFSFFVIPRTGWDGASVSFVLFNFLVWIGTVWLWISFTDRILSTSMRMITPGTRFGSSLFLIAILIALFVSIMIFPISIVVHRILSDLMGAGLGQTTDISGLMNGADFPTRREELEIENRSAFSGIEEMTMSIDVRLKAILIYLRLILVAGFIFWLLLGWLLRWIKLTIYRFFEAEKGTLTILSAVIMAAAAIVDWAIKQGGNRAD